VDDRPAAAPEPSATASPAAPQSSSEAVSSAPAEPVGASVEVIDPPRQRWRLVVGRAADAPALAQRELNDSWLGAIEAAGIPLARSEGATAKPRLSFGAPLPGSMAAEGELIDLVLTARWPAWRLREALEPLLPEGWRLIRLEDVWLGGPPLAGRVGAADYRIELDRAGPIDRPALARACATLLSSRHVPRQRTKGDRVVDYDLRPLVIDVRVTDDDPPMLIARTRFHPELGTGRPEEVVGALETILGGPVGIAGIVRQRLLLVDELESGDLPQTTAAATRVGRK
jgi:radical SAM-linked protein